MASSASSFPKFSDFSPNPSISPQIRPSSVPGNYRGLITPIQISSISLACSGVWRPRWCPFLHRIWRHVWGVEAVYWGDRLGKRRSQQAAVASSAVAAWVGLTETQPLILLGFHYSLCQAHINGRFSSPAMPENLATSACHINMRCHIS